MNELHNESPLAHPFETLQTLLRFKGQTVVCHLSAQTAVSIEQNGITITYHAALIL